MGLTQANIDELLTGDGADESAPAVAVVPTIDPSPAAAPPVPAAPRTPVVARILGLEVALSVILATRDMTIESILEVTAGTIVEFDVPFDAELSLNVGGNTIGYGQTVKIGENFGLRLTHLVGLAERANALSG